MTLRLGRVPFLLLAIAALLLGIGAGLARLGVLVGLVPAGVVAAHGPLMVAGFLATLIGLERAVAAKRPLGYTAPALTGGGALALALGAPATPARAVVTLGALALTLLLGASATRRPSSWSWLEAVAAAELTLGSAVWATGAPVPSAVPGWAAFLVLTIAAERLELARLRMPGRRARAAFMTAAVAAAAAPLLAVMDPAAGARLAGLAWLALALWLGHQDMARRSIRRPGLPRFMAVALLGGYVWLGVAGCLALALGAPMAGPRYDAILHALFLGFVFSMIFGHAPVIFGSVLGLPVAFRRRFYAHLALLHLGVALRLAGDFSFFGLRQLGGELNALAILLFLVMTVTAVKREAPSA